jgi:putative transposase
MTRAVMNWKSWLAKTEGIHLQKNFFDHRLRNDNEAGQKAEYILLNPVRAGLITRAGDWPYVWMADRAGRILCRD